MKRLWDISIKYLVVLSIPLSFVIGSAKNIIESFNYGHDSWPMTDLLINYQGGFVRRGLLGEIFYQIGSFTGIPINTVAIIFSVAAFIVVLTYFYQKVKMGGLPLLLLLSPALLGSSALGPFIIKKDYFIILFVIILTKVLKSESKLRFLTGNILICVGSLIHEAYIFLAISCVVISMALKKEKFIKQISELKRFPSLLISFVIVIFSNGNSRIASKINESLSVTWENLQGKGCCKVPEGTLGSLSWSTDKAFELPRYVLTSFSHGFWVPLGWTITYLVSFYAIKWNLGSTFQRHFPSIYVRTLICFTPIMAIGWDYGRWAFLISVTSIILLVENVTQLSSQINQVNSRSTLTRGILLLTSMPICCWGIEVAVGSTSIGWLWFNALKPLL